MSREITIRLDDAQLDQIEELRRLLSDFGTRQPSAEETAKFALEKGLREWLEMYRFVAQTKEGS